VFSLLNPASNARGGSDDTFEAKATKPLHEWKAIDVIE
jgi:hypothetical protein